MKKQRLSEIKYIYDELEQIKEQIAALETMRLSPRAAVYGSERVQTSAKGDVQPDNLIALEKLLKAYNAKLKTLTAITDEFEKELAQLSTRERLFVRMRYLEGKTPGEIQEGQDISERTYFRVMGRATRKITQKV